MDAQQSGTTDLRALLYMDEVAGYLPPTAAPPTKKPIMTLMKQARAFGVGVVLSTQNPVDIDYKALSNAGTWMIGRLQTERDKQRLLDGMSAAAGGVDVGAVGDTISGLAKREFVLKRAGKDHARGVHHPLGDELPARPADARPDRHADERAEGCAVARGDSVGGRGDRSHAARSWAPPSATSRPVPPPPPDAAGAAADGAAAPRARRPTSPR